MPPRSKLSKSWPNGWMLPWLSYSRSAMGGAERDKNPTSLIEKVPSGNYSAYARTFPQETHATHAFAIFWLSRWPTNDGQIPEPSSVGAPSINLIESPFVQYSFSGKAEAALHRIETRGMPGAAHNHRNKKGSAPEGTEP
jgi:hypothetical protein